MNDHEAVSVHIDVKATAAELELSYVISNHTAAPIWVLDRILVKQAGAWQPAPERVIVSRGEHGGVRLVLGHLAPASQEPDVEQGVSPAALPPAARELAAGASVSGTLRVRRPLASWHPYLQMATLPANAKRARLDVGYFDSTPSWHPDAPAGLQVPDARSASTLQKWAVSNEIELP